MLVYHGESDWQLASLICQVLWNFCIDMTNLNWLGADHTSQLVEVLVDFLGKWRERLVYVHILYLLPFFDLLGAYLDDERLFGTRDFIAENNSNENVLAGIYQQWEEFAVIATNLLEKIETYMDGMQQHPLPQGLAPDQHSITTSSSSNQWEEIPANTGSLLSNTHLS